MRFCLLVDPHQTVIQQCILLRRFTARGSISKCQYTEAESDSDLKEKKKYEKRLTSAVLARPLSQPSRSPTTMMLT